MFVRARAYSSIHDTEKNAAKNSPRFQNQRSLELTREEREWEQDKTLERDTEGRELAKSKLKRRKQSKTKSQNKEQGSRR